VVRLEGVTKAYKGAKGVEPVQALRGIDLVVPKGSMAAIKGPSGSGKTTLLLIIGALDAPTSGKVFVDGRDITEMGEGQLTEYRARTVGFVFQTFNLIPNLTAVENVELPMEAIAVRKAQRREKAVEVLEAVGMGDRLNYRPMKLSGGEQQRVAIARALVNDPSMILADEPTGNLDSRTGDSIVGLLSELRHDRGATVLIVTHSSDVAKMCDTTFTIRDGQITGERDEREAAERESAMRTLRVRLSMKDTVIERLYEAGYKTVEDLAEADVGSLADEIGDRKTAEKAVKRAKALIAQGRR
jgi:ABC-type lipoprotein export system ATPase subunit